MSGIDSVLSTPFFGFVVGMMILLFPMIVAVFTNLFCLRVAREVSPREKRLGSIVTSPLLYLYFLAAYPITLIVMWFPLGLSLLLIYGEDAGLNYVLPNTMNEQLLLLLLNIFLVSLVVLGFSLRAGELYRNPFADTEEPNMGGRNDLHIPMGMVF